MMSALRPAAVAGTFYPANARDLAADVGELLDGVDVLEPRFAFPKAVIAPHAGYIYSGPIAAHAYDALAPARGIVTRVVLLGPVHRVAVRGLALSDAEAFETPLGRIPIDRAAVQALADLPQVVINHRAHALEHSLEVQLPFLQRVLGAFALVPLAVGDASVDEVAEVIQRLWGGAETLVVVSTDLSHYHPYREATRIDGETVARIETLATDIRHEQACGATPLNGLLEVARQRGLAIRLLSACNSGDTAGGRDQVVGYSAFALYEGAPVSAVDAGRTLIALTRAAIAHRLGDGAGSAAEPPRTDTPSWLRQAGATFVTLMRRGSLRGCIGSLEARRGLGADVIANAIGAAFADPRFAPLSADEWADTQVEVSLLSTPKPIAFADEAELLDAIRAGEDGLIVELDGKRATFLPQVWDTLPDKRRFLAELVAKAGLPADTRLARCKVSRYRVMKWREADFASH
jgi:AmmeMemoRadiSam system protein B/AmmeMemoRadiSam system protein A